MALEFTVLNANANVGDKIKVGGNFEAKVITENLDFPWTMSYGKDGKLWITERQGKHILKIDVNTGEYKRWSIIRNFVKLDGKQAQGDVFRELKSASRYRMVVVSPDTKKIYIATDGTGNVVGNEGKATNKFDIRNSIIEIELVK